MEYYGEVRKAKLGTNKEGPLKKFKFKVFLQLNFLTLAFIELQILNLRLARIFFKEGHFFDENPILNSVFCITTSVIYCMHKT